MDIDLTRSAEQFHNRHRRDRIWKKLVSVLCCVVVFCTTYALILPAITMEREPVCGLAEHQHGEGCYTQQEVRHLACRGTGVHTHTAACADGSCGYGDFALHTHDGSCYEGGRLVCNLPEVKAHTHADDCYQIPTWEEPGHTHTDACYTDTKGGLVCGKTETEGHTHSEACYGQKQVLVCAEPESDGHHHGDGCYDEAGVLICEAEESDGHHHGEACYKTETLLICGKTEAEPHQHVDTCYKQERKLTCTEKEGPIVRQGDPELVCGRQEVETHQHSAACFDADNQWICGKREILSHTHTDACFETATEPVLTCGLEEHTHSDECYPAEETTTETTVETTTETTIETTTETTESTTEATTEETTEATEESTEVKRDESNAALLAAPFSLNRLSGVSVSGVDLSNCVTSVVFKKKVGSVWEPSTEFTTDDQAQADISFAGLSKEALVQNGNTAYLKLPSSFDCSRFHNSTFATYDGSTQSGTYVFQKNGDDWYIVLTLSDDYVNSAESHVNGTVKLNFEWDGTWVGDEGRTDSISIGSWISAESITVNPGQQTDSDVTGNSYSLMKTGDLKYDSAGYYYIDYQAILTVNNDTPGPITLTDTLTGNGWSFDDTSLKVSSGGISWTNTAEGTGKTITVGQEGETITAGTYTISYRVKLSAEDGGQAQSVDNRIAIQDGGNELSSQTWTNARISPVDKQGKLTEEDGTKYIDYTVYINSGDIVQNLSRGEVFRDTLPAEVDLVGEAQIEQYDPDGNKVASDTATVGENNILSYTLPEGRYYYIITYRTQVKANVTIPIGGLPISNTAEVLGKQDTENVTIPNRVLSKSFESQSIAESDGSWKDTLTWSSEIDVSGSLNGYVYEDWASTVWLNDEARCPMYMTDGQISGIQIKDSSGNPIIGGYSIERNAHDENGIQTGLFKITFGEVQGPVTIHYETTVDLSDYAIGTYLQFTNKASVSIDGNWDSAQASSDQIAYVHDMPSIIKKTKSSNLWNVSSADTVLSPGETTIPWLIIVNDGKVNLGDLTVTDTIADGMTLVEESLKVTIWGQECGAVSTYDEATNTLTIQIPESGYNGHPITISYRTRLPNSFLNGTETTREFRNTASVTGANLGETRSSFTQNVTRQVVGKSGSYDKVAKTLSYHIVLNPDGNTWNNGNKLTVTDTLDRGALGNSVSLKNLKLYTALKTQHSDGSIKVVPGAFVCELEARDDGAVNSYIWNSGTGTFTAYVPDSTAYVLVAKYSVDADIADSVQMKNSVSLKADSQEWSAKDEATMVAQDTSGSTEINGHRLILTKRDSAQYSLTLQGAQFKLEQYDAGNWVQANGTNVYATLTTDGNGQADTILLSNVLYRLTETAAPAGYLLDATPYYFAIGHVEPVPQDVEVNYYELPDAESVKIELDRFNAKDKDLVKTGELRVNKQWADASGIITDPVALAAMPEVTLTLTKYHSKVDVVLLAGTWAGAHKVEVPNVSIGGYLLFTVQNYQYGQIGEIDGYTVSATQNSDGTYTVALGPIMESCTIINSTLPFASSIDKAGPSDEKEIVSATTIGTVKLNPENDWTYLWQDLPISGGETYRLDETAVDGYEVAFLLNGEDLAEGAVITPGSDGDKVTVINSETGAYELPETGGSGTEGYTLGGLALTAGAALWLLCRRKRRREDG